MEKQEGLVFFHVDLDDNFFEWINPKTGKVSYYPAPEGLARGRYLRDPETEELTLLKEDRNLRTVPEEQEVLKPSERQTVSLILEERAQEIEELRKIGLIHEETLKAVLKTLQRNTFVREDTEAGDFIQIEGEKFSFLLLMLEGALEHKIPYLSLTKEEKDEFSFWNEDC